MTARMRLRFAYDVVCPFAYLAFQQLDRVRALADVELQPVLLGGLLRHEVFDRSVFLIR